jgi:hypothetical protein
MIKGNKETIEKVRKAGPNDKWNHVNFDAIEMLPDEFEAHITELKYTASDWYDIGNNTFMPKPEILYNIADACGISGGDNSIHEPLIEFADLNRIRAELNAPPNMVKMNVGRIVKKYSVILKEDGTERRSSICSVSYNAYERCSIAWSDEEQATNGYTVEIKNGKYQIKDKDFWGEYYMRGSYAFGIKYRTRWQRQAHFDNEMKFAGAKAESKAHGKTIRELAGLMTGYKKEDLKDGFLVFVRIQRSSQILKLETAARLSAMSKEWERPKLFDIPGKVEFLPEPKSVESSEKPVSIDIKGCLISTINAYINNKSIHPDDIPDAKRIVEWAERQTIHPNESQYWPNVIDTLNLIESKIPGEGRISHGLTR